MLRFVAIVSIVLPIVFGFSPPEPYYVQVVRVHSGDQITLSTGWRVTYACIDAPDFAGNHCYAQDAAQYNYDLTMGQGVRVVETREGAHVYVGSTWINREMVARGYARVTEGPMSPERKALLRAERDAAQVREGAWGICWEDEHE